MKKSEFRMQNFALPRARFRISDILHSAFLILHSSP